MASMSVSRRLLSLALMLAILAVFAPVLKNGFVWDDHRLLDSNATGFLSPDAWKDAITSDFWKGADAGRAGGDHRLYRPLLKLVLVAEYRLFGTEVPGAWHLVSLLLHIANGVLVFRWLRRRFDATAPAELLGVFAGALLFAVHPTRGESVAWLSAASDLWAALFVLLALEAWDRSLTIVATLGFVAALFFKESSAAVPVALAADALWLAPDAAERRRRFLRALIPIVSVVAAFGARLLIVPLKDGGSLHNTGDRQERFFATVAQFTRMALWPVHPTTQAGYIPSTAFGGDPVYPRALVIAGPAILIALLVFAWVAVRRPSWRPALADVSWFWILALPALNLIPLAGLQFTGERFLYLPGLGFAALVGRGLVGEVRRTDSLRRIAVVGVTFVLATFAMITRNHVKDFASDLSLWSAERLNDPKNGFVLEQLNLAAMDAHQYELAMLAASQSFLLQPSPKGKAYMFVEWLKARAESVKDDPRALRQLRADADAFAEGGTPVGQSAWLAARIPSEGVQWLRTYSVFTATRAWLALRTLDYDRAIELAKVAGKDPIGRASAWRCAVMTRVAQGQWEQALAMVHDPRAPEHWAGLVDRRGTELGSRIGSLYRLGELSLARRLALEALAVQPDLVDAIQQLVMIDLQLKYFPEARRIANQSPPAEAAWRQSALDSIGKAEKYAAKE